MKSCLVRSEQFQELDKKLAREADKLTREIQAGHVPIFQRLLEKKLHCIDESKTLMYRNPDMAIDELDIMLNKRIEREARKLDKSKSFERMETNSSLYYERLVKECVHELGHSFGISHCDNPECVMHFSNSLHETDIKERSFCHLCNGKKRPNDFVSLSK